MLEKVEPAVTRAIKKVVGEAEAAMSRRSRAPWPMPRRSWRRRAPSPASVVMTDYEPLNAPLLRRLAINDEGAIDAVFAGTGDEMPQLGDKSDALVRFAALVASDSAAASYQWAITAALAAGVTDDEVVGALIAVAPIVGVARIVSAAAMVARALGYELDLAD